MAGRYKPAIKKLDYYETGGGGGGAVDSVNGETGEVILDKTDIGLGNVDNTSDVDKPVSTAQQTALDGKVDENAPITGATKTKVTYDAKGLVTGGADATTADIADSTNKRYVTDAQQTVISNTSGVNTGDQDLSAYQLEPSEGAFVNGDKTKLDGIESGAEVNNISDANATDLTDGGDSSLHYHSSDRNRSNHTGTQAASTISDFNTAADARVTYEALNTNGDVGTGATQIAQGNHSHAGGSAPADQMDYTFSTTTTASDPGAGYFRLNYNTVETITTKVLTANVATLTTVATHGYDVGQYVYVAIGDSVFDGLQRITAVNAGAKTFSFAKTNASIASTAASGTALNVTKITDLYIDTTGTSVDYTETLKSLQPGDTLFFANTTTATKWLRFRVSQVPTNNTGWFTIKIVYTGGSLAPANNDAITIVTERNQGGKVHFWTSATAPTETPPSTLGADGDICFIKPSTTTKTSINYGWRISEKVNGAWLTTSTSGTNTNFIPYIPVMGASTTPTPVTGQAVSSPQDPGSGLVVPSDWYRNSSAPQALVSSSRYYALQPGDKVSIGKGLGSFGQENMAFFNGQASVSALPMDIDAIKMKFSTNTAASDPGTEYIKVNNATASSVTEVYCSELGYNRTITNKVLTSGIATLTTSAAHSYFVGQSVTVTGVDTTFNGTYILTAVAATTFSYARNYTVQTKELTSNVATLYIGTHPFIIGSSITVSSVDATFNGTYTVTAITATTVSYAKTASNVPNTSSGGMVAYPDVISVASGGTANANVAQQFTRSAVATPPAYTEQAPYAIRITQDSDTTRYIHVWKNAAATDNGTWQTTPATFAQVGAGGLPANASDVTVRFYYNNAYWVANGYGESQYGIGVCVRGDGNVSLRGVADRGIYDSKGGTAYITNTVLTSNVVTITTSQVHGFAVGDSVTITNATNTTYNGTYTITTVPTTTTFTYAKTNANIGSAVSIGEACNGAIPNDYIAIDKYVSGFTAFLVRNNTVVYELPRSSVAKFKLVQLLAYDDLLGTQGLMATTTSRDHQVISPKFTY